MAYNESRPGYDREHRGMLRNFRLAVALILLLLIALALVGAAVLRDDGMSPDYRGGRVVLYYRLGRDCRRGELVCLRLPDGRAALRRVVAASGDSVDLRDGIAYINGLAERGSYSITRTDPRPEGPSYPLILRPGEYFVLGDARESAEDSRSFGVVRREEILGKLIL